jgi:hypothetical protein
MALSIALRLHPVHLLKEILIFSDPTLDKEEKALTDYVHVCIMDHHSNFTRYCAFMNVCNSQPIAFAYRCYTPFNILH